MLLFDDFAPDPTPVRVGPKPSPDPACAKLPLAGGELIGIVTPLSAKTRGVLVTLKGDAGDCTMILRTSAMRPGQGYQARLMANPDWRTVNLLLSDFRPVGGVLRRMPRPEALCSYAILPTAGDIFFARVRFY